MDKKRKSIIEGNEISGLYTFGLGGVQQKVLIEGKYRTLPVVICLHGGPGSPVPFSVGCRGMFPEFTDRFIMVYWDQLGCGINDCKLGDRYGISDFVQMTSDLIDEIKALFPENRIMLFGMSWGSVLALKCAQKADAVVTWGQVVRSLFFNDIVLKALEKSAVPVKKLEKIKSIEKDRASGSDIKLISDCIRKYTDGYTNKNGEKAPMGPVIKGLMTSPDYSLRDFKAIAVNGTMTSTRLWPELLKTDLSAELGSVTVPYTILEGDSDIVTPVEFAGEACQNPNIRLKTVKNSGHMPGTKGMEAVFEALLDSVK